MTQCSIFYTPESDPAILSHNASAAKIYNATSRVTRLGEFSPNVSLFTLGSFVKITEVAPIFGQFF
jgi:hypothetical protein